MTHEEIQKQEIIERYVRHQLAPAERSAFQEHYFSCNECFVEVQLMTKFIAGVRQAARKGVLDEASPALPWWRTLFNPAFGFTVAALLIAFVAGWFYFKQTNAPPSEIVYQSTPTPSPVVSPTASAAPLTSPPLPKLIEQPDLLAQNRPPVEPSDKPPLVLLDSARDAGANANQLALPANATRAILRIETDPMSDYTGYQFQIFDKSRRLVATAASGKASKRGAVSASLPTSTLQNGKYLVKCFGLRDGQRELVGEYDLQVRKP